MVHANYNAFTLIYAVLAMAPANPWAKMHLCNFYTTYMKC